MPLSPGQILNNRFRIVTLLGQGGFGAVYKVWDINLKRPMALKENLDTSPDAQRQFLREAQMLASLDHPNLTRVTLYFVIAQQGQYLVRLLRRRRTGHPLSIYPIQLRLAAFEEAFTHISLPAPLPGLARDHIQRPEGGRGPLPLGVPHGVPL